MDTQWAIGDLARAAGVSVRTLRYYEEIGLLASPERTSRWHRRYTDDDVSRLYEIVALRSLGLGLDAVREALDGSMPTLADVMRRQLEQVDERIERDERLRKRLLAITAAIPLAGDPSPSTLLDVMEMITMADNTATRVEGLLRSTGYLTTGRVSDLVEEPLGGHTSHVTRLRMRYSPDASPTAPGTLVLKENLPVAWAVAGGAQEVQFYRTISGLPDHPDIVPSSYGARYDMVTGDSQILLADLGATHHAATADTDSQVAGDVPPATSIEQVVDTLARLHAYWWDNPLLRDGIFPLLDFNGDTTRWSEYERHRSTSWESVGADLGHPIPRDARQVVEQVFAGFASHWQIYMQDRVRGSQEPHADARRHVFRELPRARRASRRHGRSAGLAVPHRQHRRLRPGEPVCDVLDPEQREEGDREAEILHRYFDALVAGGVTDYTWDQLCQDYRAGIIYWVLVPLQDAHDGAAPSYWLPKLECLAQAFDDWNCATLL